MVPVSGEVEVIDTVDDPTIVEMMTGQALQDYVYSFDQGGRVVEGLTLVGINEAANRRDGIQVKSIDYEERDKTWVATAEAIDTITGNSRFGLMNNRRTTRDDLIHSPLPKRYIKHSGMRSSS